MALKNFSAYFRYWRGYVPLKIAIFTLTRGELFPNFLNFDLFFCGIRQNSESFREVMQKYCYLIDMKRKLARIRLNESTPDLKLKFLEFLPYFQSSSQAINNRWTKHKIKLAYNLLTKVLCFINFLQKPTGNIIFRL